MRRQRDWEGGEKEPDKLRRGLEREKESSDPFTAAFQYYGIRSNVERKSKQRMETTPFRKMTERQVKDTEPVKKREGLKKRQTQQTDHSSRRGTMKVKASEILEHHPFFPFFLIIVILLLFTTIFPHLLHPALHFPG